MARRFVGKSRRVPGKEKKPKKPIDRPRIVKTLKIRFTQVLVPKQLSERRVRQSSKTNSPKGFQFSPEFLEILVEYPELITDFLTLRTVASHITGIVRNRYLSIQRFDPGDQSKHHDVLYKVRLKGRAFFVKEVLNPATPVDAISQFEAHDRVTILNHQMQPWRARVLVYHAAWKSRQESFLVSEWVNGVSLENWLSQPQGPKKDEVYQRFLRMERFLKRQRLRDVTTRNVIYNPKTDELMAIDLLPS